MTCDLCDRPAVVHATEVNGGVTTERHLCERHAAEVPELAQVKPRNDASSGFTDVMTSLSAEKQAMAGLAANLRGAANFIRRHARMPATAADLEEGMSLRAPFPIIEIADPNLRTYLQESDAFLQFYDTCEYLALSPPDESPGKEA
jgi:hypothetical protein